MNFGLAQTTEPPGPRHKPLVVNVVNVGAFEEEEEEIGVTSDVVKVKGEDPDTPGFYGGQGKVGTSAIMILDRGCVSLGSLTMKPRDRT